MGNAHAELLRAGLLVALVAAAVPTRADAYTIGRCAAEAEAAIDKLGIDRAKIGEIATDIQYGGRGRQVVGITLWIRSPACRGSVALSFDASCNFTGPFDRGECELEDIKR
jgi:hypothetical protein